MPRKSVPAALKLLEGRSPGRDSGGRVVKAPPGYSRLPPEPPAILLAEPSGVALALWHKVVPELQRLHLTKPLDAEGLASYCLTWARLCEAQKLINEEGVLAENSQGRVRHPAVAVVEAASKELRVWCNEFGFTPAAESKVGRQEVESDDAVDPFASTG